MNADNDVRLTFRNVFPGLLGVSLGRRMDADVFHQVMAQVAEAESLDDARRSAQIAKIVDKLKGDSSKRFSMQTPADAIDVVAARSEMGS